MNENSSSVQWGINILLTLTIDWPTNRIHCAIAELVKGVWYATLYFNCASTMWYFLFKQDTCRNLPVMLMNIFICAVPFTLCHQHLGGSIYMYVILSNTHTHTTHARSHRNIYACKHIIAKLCDKATTRYNDMMLITMSRYNEFRYFR